MEKYIQIQPIETPLGFMHAHITSKGLRSLAFIDSLNANNIPYPANNQKNNQLNVYAQETKKQVEDFFAGRCKTFNIPLDIIGTPFQRLAWQTLLDIPYGTTCTYQQQAQTMGNPKAIRAVANANRVNPTAIIIPCHRVIGSNGLLTGYAGGLKRKKWLIEHEKNMTKESSPINEAGKG